MEDAFYVFGLLLAGAIVWVIVKTATGNRYANMTDEEFEAEAKRSSSMAPAIMEIQKIFDPSHRVEYVQEQQERAEADAAESGDRPETGSSILSRDRRAD